MKRSRSLPAWGLIVAIGMGGPALAADPSRGSGTTPSASGQEGADMDKSRGGNMGGQQRGEASLKQEQREKEESSREQSRGGKDPLEQRDPGPGSSRSSGVGAGQ